MTSSTSTPVSVSDRPTLLLADDSVTIQRVIELTFAHEDIQVIAVGDGDHAIATLRHSHPDIVLADVGMPGKNGYELAAHIKQTPALAHVPVLLLTGAFEPIDQARAREVGCDGVLVKPFEPQAVIQRVKELLAAAAAKAGHVESPIAPVTRPANADQLDDYFDQLNQAFTQRMAASPATAPTLLEELPQVVAPMAALSSASDSPSQEAPVLDAPLQAPLLAGAFSALLAAEQSAGVPDPFVEWLPSAAAPRDAAISEQAIELIVRRVVEQMSDRVVREIVTAIATETAERLVREEIERIKSNIK